MKLKVSRRGAWDWGALRLDNFALAAFCAVNDAFPDGLKAIPPLVTRPQRIFPRNSTATSTSSPQAASAPPPHPLFGPRG